MITTRVTKNLTPNWPYNYILNYSVEDYHIPDFPKLWSWGYYFDTSLWQWKQNSIPGGYLIDRDPTGFYPHYIRGAVTGPYVADVVYVSYVELKDSVSSTVAPALYNAWVLEFCHTKDKTRRSRPTVPELIKVRPFILRPPRSPTLKIITASDLRLPRNGLPWKPKKLQRLLVERHSRSQKLYDQERKTFELRKRIYDSLVLAHQKKIKSISAVNKRRQKNYEKRLSNWMRAQELAKRRFLSAKQRRHRYTTVNPYRRLKLYNSGDTGSSYSMCYDSHWGYMMSGGGQNGDNRYFTAPFVTSKWEHTWYAYVPATAIDTPAKETLLAEGLYRRFTGVVSGIVAELTEKGERKIISKLSNQKVNIGNLLAERHQTLSLLRTNLNRLVDLVTLKKGIIKNVKMAIQNPKQWANEILAFKFGVEPLVKDVQTALDYLSKDDTAVTLTVRTKDSRFVSVSANGVTFSGHVVVRHKIIAEMDNVMFQKLNEWGLTNPLSIGWEFTPWSFVVDWVIPIGSYLASLTALTGLTFSTGTRHVTIDGVFTKDNAVNIGDINSYSSVCIDGTWNGKVEYREILNGFPNGFPLVMKNPLSNTHGLEAICLLIQKFKNK